MTWLATFYLRAFVVILQVALIQSDENGPMPGFTQEPIDTIVRSRNQTILCTVKGEQPLKVTWLRNGHILNLEKEKYITIASEGALNIYFTERQRDQGEYRCVVENKHGRVISRIAKLTFPYMNDFTALDSRVIVNKGDKAYLPCHAPQSYPDRHIYWSKLKNSGSFPLQLDKQTHFTTSENGDLYFSYTETSDIGVYYCSVENNNLRRVLKRTVVLRIRDAVEQNMAPEVWMFNNKIAIKDSDTMLECIAYGRPIPVMQFRNVKSGHVLTGSQQIGNRLRHQFSKFEEKDEGEYSCELSNTYGQRASKSAYIKMEAKPKMITKSRAMVIAIDSAVSLPCVATGRPLTTYRWFYNGNLLSPNADISIHQGNITFRKVLTHHGGFYQCVAHNKHGEDIMTIHFKVIEKMPTFEHPSIRPAQTTRAIVGGSVEINCVPHGAPKPTLTWRKKNSSIDIIKNERFTVLSTGTLRIVNIRKSDEGKYECIAKNKLGKASAEGNLIVTDGLGITEPLTRSDEIVIGQTMTLKCKISSFDKVEVVFRWYRGHTHSRKLLRNRGRVKIVRVNSKESTLIIDDVNERDTGFYTCQAKGTKNTDSRSQLIVVTGPNGHEVPWIPSGPQTTTVPYKESTKLILIEPYISTPTKGPPEAPAGVKATELQGLNLKISWTNGRSNGADLTNIFIQARTTFDVDNWETIFISKKTQRDREYEIVQLSPWVEYKIRVLAENKHGLSEPSIETKKWIRTPTAKPLKYPSQIRGNGTGPNEITVSFEPLDEIDQNAPGIEYIIYHRQKDASRQFVSTSVDKGQKSLRITFQSTDSFYKPYEFQVQAKNNEGFGPKSPVHVVYTGERTPLVVPTNLNVRITSSTSAVASWDQVDKSRELMRGSFIGYKLLYWVKPELNHPKLEQYVASYGTTATFKLKPYTEYYFQVLAFNSAGDGPASNTIGPMKTPEGKPSQPTNFKITDATNSEVTLTWNEPSHKNGELLQYMLTYYSLSNSDDVKQKELSTDQLFIVLSNLEPDSTYVFQIAASTFVGLGDVAEIQFDFSKLPTVVPSKPIVGSIGHHAIVLTWTPSLSQKVISGYKIFYWSADDETSKSVALWESRDDIITTIQNLKPDTLYSFQLAVVNQYGTGPKSEITTAKTKIDENGSKVPQDGHSKGSSSIKLKFSNYIMLVFLLIAILVPR